MNSIDYEMVSSITAAVVLEQFSQDYRA